MIETILILSTTVSSILIILLKTDVIFEYLKVLPLSNKAKFSLLIKPYENQIGMYPNILFFWHSVYSQRPVAGFLLKIATCPYCAGFWLAAGLSCAAGHWYLTFVVYFFSLVGYFFIDKWTEIE
jgi:hypothetical protein